MKNILSALFFSLFVISVSSQTLSEGPNNSVFVTNMDSDVILQYDSEGSFLGRLTLDGPFNDMAFGMNGTLYVNINQSHRIVGYDPDGTASDVITLESPVSAMAIGPGGELFVNINQSHRVTKYSKEGWFLSEFDAGTEIKGLAVGEHAERGQITVAFTDSNRVLVFNENGEMTDTFQLDTSIRKLALSPAGEIVVLFPESAQTYLITGEFLRGIHFNKEYSDFAVNSYGEMVMIKDASYETLSNDGSSNLYQDVRVETYSSKGILQNQWLGGIPNLLD